MPKKRKEPAQPPPSTATSVEVQRLQALVETQRKHIEELNKQLQETLVGTLLLFMVLSLPASAVTADAALLCHKACNSRAVGVDGEVVECRALQEAKRQQQLQLLDRSPAPRNVRQLLARAAADNTALARKVSYASSCTAPAVCPRVAATHPMRQCWTILYQSAPHSCCVLAGGRVEGSEERTLSHKGCTYSTGSRNTGTACCMWQPHMKPLMSRTKHMQKRRHGGQLVLRAAVQLLSTRSDTCSRSSNTSPDCCI
jgi:hypothetical protein